MQNKISLTPERRLVGFSAFVCECMECVVRWRAQQAQRINTIYLFQDYYLENYVYGFYNVKTAWIIQLSH